MTVRGMRSAAARPWNRHSGRRSEWHVDRHGRWAWALAMGLLMTATPAWAQEEPQETLPDSVRADTLLTARDSAMARVRQRLGDLARPPGTAPDTLPTPERPGARRRTRGALPQGDAVTNELLGLPGYRASRYSAVAARFESESGVLVLYGSEGAPDVGSEPDTLTTAEADSVTALADSLAARVDSIGEALRDTVASPDGREALVARMDSLRVVADSLHRLASPGEGPAVVRASLATSEGYRLEADRFVRFNQRTEQAEARGDPTYVPADGSDPVESDSLNIDIGQERASAFAARTRYQQQGGTNWNVSGDLPWVGQNLIYGHSTRFTSCDLEVPHYHFETDNLKIVQGQVLVARPVKLYFADVPVAWLPFVAQSLATGRASGLLTPRFSVNDIVRTSGGYRRRLSNVGFYWAMSDYTDATMAMDWFDDTYVSLTSSLRFRWLRQFLNGTVSLRQYWRDEGSTERSIDSQTRWEISERTRFNASVRYASSTDFVRRNSFDPREVTQQITSSGGVSHRFDWGTLNLTGNRRQSLSNDEVNMTLPDLSLSMNTLTLFPAPPNRASWFNNMSLSGSGKYNRSIVDRAPDTTGFRFSTADQGQTRVTANVGLSMGAFSLGQSLQYNDDVTRGVPLDSLVFFPGQAMEQGLSAFDGRLGQAILGQQEEDDDRRVDVAEAELTWSTSLSYQQNLIGSTTFTPRLSVSGQARQADTVDVAQSFVSGPRRVSFGATLKADVYGFYPGFGGFEAVRHKITPSFTYDWSPEVDPTDLQGRVFGARTARPRSLLGLTFNQTWEAKRSSDEEDPDTAAVPGDGSDAPATSEEPAGIDDSPPEEAATDPPGGPDGDDGEPRRLEQGETLNLLSITTSALRYDFVEADSVNSFLGGFQTTTLQNQISSDFLRGLTVSMTHDLFTEDLGEPGEGEERPAPGSARKFDPHLQRLNFGFNLNARSSIFGLLGLGGGDGTAGAEDDEIEDEPYEQRSATDETSILPGEGTDYDVRQRRAPQAGGRPAGGAGWRAAFAYSLNRPRSGGDAVSQMLSIRLNLRPTELWEMSWDTAYNIEDRAFNDHRIRLTRDLHRWQANFDFLKTATGNWSFRFEVSLLDNEELKFDYEQRNLEEFGGRTRLR